VVLRLQGILQEVVGRDAGEVEDGSRCDGEEGRDRESEAEHHRRPHAGGPAELSCLHSASSSRAAGPPPPAWRSRAAGVGVVEAGEVE